MMDIEIKKVKRQRAMELLGVSRSRMIKIQNELGLTVYKFSPSDRLVYYDWNEIQSKLKPVEKL